MLLRDETNGSEPPGVEVFVMHRVAGMAFAPSVTVFPGGGVDPTDFENVPWSGPDRQWWARALGIADGNYAAALVMAAVRELFEETGVLLADRAAPEALRQSVTDHRISMAQLLIGQHLSLRSDLLRPWANWITPGGSPRRYDTFFFLAALPDGQHARLMTTEAETGRWARPVDLLAEHGAGTLAMMPPTLAMLMDLQRAGSVRWVMSQERTVLPVLPTVRSRPGEPLEVEVDGRVFPLRRPGR